MFTTTHPVVWCCRCAHVAIGDIRDKSDMSVCCKQRSWKICHSSKYHRADR